MKKIGFIFVFIVFSTFVLISCGKKEEKPESKSSVTSKQKEAEAEKEEKKEPSPEELKKAEEEKKALEAKEAERKAEEEIKAKTAEWVKESPLSEGKSFQLPQLNETVFGERAKTFNKEIEEFHSVSKEFYDEPSELSMASEVTYETHLHLPTKTFSLVAKLLGINGDVIYRTFVADVDTMKELSFEEAVKRAGLTGDEVRKIMEQFYTTIYASASYDYLNEAEADLELEDYLSERMSYFDGSIKKETELGVNPTFFAINEGKLDLFTVIRAPGTGVFFYKPYYVRKDLAENALLNANTRSLIAMISQPESPDVMKSAKIVKEITTESSGEKYYFLALLDDVKLTISEIEYDEKEENFKETATLFEKELKAGEAVGLDAVLPEGMPYIRIKAEAVMADAVAGEERLLTYLDEMVYQGRFTAPVIEYLDGKWIEE